MKKIIIAGLAALFLQSCAVNLKVKYDNLDLNTSNVKTNTIDIALLDNRELVKKGHRKPDFVGDMRGGYGNAFPMKTVSEKPFMDDLANSLQASFNKQNITVEIVPTNHNQTDKEVADLLLVKNGNKKMMFHIHQLHTDGYGVQFLYYTIDVKIFDQNKQLLKQKTFTGKDKLGGDAFWGAGKFNEYMPQAVKKVFDEILNDTEISENLNR